MPFTAHFGEMAERENERRATSYEQLLVVAAQNLVDEASRSLQDSIAECQAESVRAVSEMRAMLGRVYLMFGAAIVALLASLAVIVAVVVTHA